MARVTWRMVGGDGIATLVLANLLILATLGLSWLWQVLTVGRIALGTRADAGAVALIVVLGMRLDGGRVRPAFARRLERGLRLAQSASQVRVLVVGGRTDPDTPSEAEVGRRFLVEAGLAAGRILVADTSRHTLENLQEARPLILAHVPDTVLLITSRTHLARSLAMARGMGLALRPCAAEETFDWNVSALPAILLEAYLLHWYVVGRCWSRLTRNEKSLARIS